MDTTLEATVSNDLKKASSSGTFNEIIPRRYVCYACGKRFSNNSNLKQHMNTLHFKEKQFQCDICLKAFRRNSNLKRHKVIHDTKPHFVCDKCESGFSRKDNLKHHMKGYSCTICEKTFCRKYELKMHIRDPHVSSSEVSSVNPYIDEVKYHKRENALNVFSTTTFDCCEEFAKDIFAFLNSIRGSIESELKYQLYEKKCFKWNLMMEVLVKPSFQNEISEYLTLYLDSNTLTAFSESELSDSIDLACDELMIAFEQYVEIEISWTLVRIKNLYVSIAKYDPL